MIEKLLDKTFFYLTSVENCFNPSCCIAIGIENPTAESIRRNAEIFAKPNGYNQVFVYDMDYNLIGNYNN